MKTLIPQIVFKTTENTIVYGVNIGTSALITFEGSIGALTIGNYTYLQNIIDSKDGNIGNDCYRNNIFSSISFHIKNDAFSYHMTTGNCTLGNNSGRFMLSTRRLNIEDEVQGFLNLLSNAEINNQNSTKNMIRDSNQNILLIYYSDGVQVISNLSV